MPVDTKLLEHIQSSPLTLSEQVQACCTIAREQLEVGDYEAGCGVLQEWWSIGEWPKQNGLSQAAAAELLLTAGILTGWVDSTRQIEGGQKRAEQLLSGAIALFDQLGRTTSSAEGLVELGYCYYRQGLFDLARSTLRSSLRDLAERETELKGIALIRMASVERHVSRLHDALGLLNEAGRLTDSFTSWTKGRYHLEFATTLKNLGIAEDRSTYFDKALGHYREALSHFEALGNRRYTAIVENNRGFLLSILKRFGEAQLHLEQARRLFEELGDSVRRSQVDETLAKHYLASGHYEMAQRAVSRAIEAMETSGEEALLAEALTTHGLVLCKLGRRHEAKPILHRAQRVAERCGDHEGAAKPLLILIEEICDQLSDDERREIGARLDQLLANSQQGSTRERLRNCLDRITAAHLEHEAQRERAAHADKMAALGELSFGVAHNVNNTLTGILGRAQLLMRTTDPAKIANGIQLIVKSAEDGAQIIKRIQNFARQRPNREFAALSVEELLKDVCEMTRPRWESRPEAAATRLTLLADCTAQVMGDPVELREVLVNMIYNAIDAMPKGGEIRMSAQEAGERVILNISDNGTGMPPEVKSRLFDPFFTTKGKAGTGMGLAVSFGIVRRHNGSIEVESEVGRGTTFRLSLPRATDTRSSMSRLDSSVSAAPAERKLRILVVDDEAAVREVLTDSLRAEGCEVLAADSGQVALALFDAHNGEFDAVFTDIGMPEMGGWELATAIRRRSDSVSLAIVSGWADAISCDTRSAVKADWVISKPFDINRISEIVEEIAERRNLASFP